MNQNKIAKRKPLQTYSFSHQSGFHMWPTTAFNSLSFHHLITYVT